MIKNPKFSIIIPVYNVENYLSECLDSLIHQTLEDIEIICVNDGSNDQSEYVLKAYANLDPRIHIIEKKNGGVSSARNIGLEIATGEYILFTDSDDYLELTACERVYYEILDHSPDIVVFGMHLFPRHPQPAEWLIYNSNLRVISYWNNGINALLYENGSTPFVWRECFKREFLLENKLIFDEGLWLSEDLVFLFKAFPNANRIIYIPDKLYHYRWERNNSAMNKASCNLFRKYQSHIDAVEKIAQYWEENKFMLSRGGDFFAWSVAFLGADLTHYSGSGKNILIKRIWDVWETFNLNKYYDMLSSENKFYYKQLSSIVNKMDNIAN